MRRFVLALAAVISAGGFGHVSSADAAACYYSGDKISALGYYIDGYSYRGSEVKYQIGYTCTGMRVETRVISINVSYRATGSGQPQTRQLGWVKLFKEGFDGNPSGLEWHTDEFRDCYMTCSMTLLQSVNKVIPYDPTNNVWTICNNCGVLGWDDQSMHYFMEGYERIWHN